MRPRWIAFGAVAFLVWLGATFGVAFAVVEWRSDNDPNFFCRETFRAAVQGEFDSPAAAAKNVRIACGDDYQLPGASNP